MENRAYDASGRFEACVEITISVLRTRSPKSIQPLKNFLTILPTSTAISQVFIKALEELAVIDPEVCHWALGCAHDLKPELDLFEIAKQLAVDKLKQCGFELNHSFTFDAAGQFSGSEQVKAALMVENSAFTQLLFETLLQLKQPKAS